jgi:hypothetical protein
MVASISSADELVNLDTNKCEECTIELVVPVKHLLHTAHLAVHNRQFKHD